jgi:hypothetical protein
MKRQLNLFLANAARRPDFQRSVGCWLAGTSRLDALVLRYRELDASAWMQIRPFPALDFAVQNFLHSHCAFLRTSTALYHIMGLSGVLHVAAASW